MRSTFMGLEASKKGLFVQQSALYTTGHNISNANTDGYSRQRVNMQATPGYPYPGLNSPTYPGHLGTGVEVGSIQRIRDQFIDRQYRQETNKLGYWESTLQSINQMEDILSEPSEFGINQSFNDFWKALEDVSTNPEDTAARKVALAKAEALADSFNYNYTQLQTIQGNIGNEISVSTTKINSLLKQISEINAQVQAVEPNGYVTNDLYDARDVLVDQLNELLPVSIMREKSGGNASEVAEGSLTIQFNGILLVSGNEYAELRTVSNDPPTPTNTDINKRDELGNLIPILDADGKVQRDPQTGDIEYEKENVAIYDATTTWDSIDGNDLTETFTGIVISEIGFPPKSEQVRESNFVEHKDLEASKGKLVALIDAYGYSSEDVNGNPVVKGTYPDMLANLDKLANAFKEAFNKVHQQGHSLEDGIDVTANPYAEFFEGNGAKGLKVNENYLKNPVAIAASTGAGEEGNGKWAIELANLQFLGMSANQAQNILGVTVDLRNVDLDGATFQSFYKGMIGDLAVAGQEAARLEYNSGTLRLTIENNRASMSSVSLDEEMTNMITFQQAYNANARMITVVDETLDKIINGMGRVGL